MKDNILPSSKSEKSTSYSSDYERWKNNQSLAGHIYLPILKILEKRGDVGLVLSWRGAERDDFALLDSEKWTTFEAVVGDDRLDTVSQSVDVAFRRFPRNEDADVIHTAIEEITGSLRTGGAVIVEQELAKGFQKEAEEAFRRYRYSFDCAGLHILATSVIAPTNNSDLGATSERALTVIGCSKSDYDARKTADLERSVNEIVIRNQFVSLSGREDHSSQLVNQISASGSEEFLQMHYTLQAQAESAEAMIASLSETALSAKDASRRLLKVERRVLALRKQTSLFLPVTFPWSLFAGFVVSLVKRRKEKRKKKGSIVAEVKGSSFRQISVEKDILVENGKALGEDGFPDTPKILVLKLDHIGDFFLSLPAVDLLKKAWPAAEITLVCSPTNGDLARSSGYFHDVIEFKFSAEMSQEVQKAQLENYARIKSIVSGYYDLAIDLRHDPDTRPLLMFVHARVKAGFQGTTRFFTPLNISLPEMEVSRGAYKNAHNVHRLMLLSSHVVNSLKGFDSGQIMSGLVQSGGSNDLSGFDRYVVIAPGGGTLAKKWAPAKFARLAEKLVQDHGYKIVVVGGNAEAEYRDAIFDAIPEQSGRDLIGKLPLKNLASVIAEAEFFIGTDTGATHLSALIGVPTIVIFSGVADHHIWEPMGRYVCIVRRPIACAPCHIARIEECVAEHKCMVDIEVDDVYRAFTDMASTRLGKTAS
ncbi:glycosyltransferase family 9 protein [Agrobacterium pusense]|uniref:glycosyltransferase family 9 protein n=1 Tax=Agrobacterium pusense TaxID=648995 RepID=UPI001C6E3A57|nr:glycosyltransferase family 9 protein [Agrobacterium pusense]MBW9059775.1 glycosyltransferase family 9 protein [Agrobacterium pusense]